MRKYLPWFFATIFLATAHAQSVTLTMGGVAAGTNKVPMTINGLVAESLAGIQFTLNFDPAEVTVVSVEAGPASAAAKKSISCASGTGTYTCLLVGVNTNVFSNGIVAYATLTLATSPANVSLTNTLGADIDANEVAISGTGGLIYGGDVTCDVNGDGSVNILDVQLARRMAQVLQACTIKINSNLCNVVTTRRVINVVLGDACVVGP